MELVINLHEDRIPLFDISSRAQIGSTNGLMLCGAHSQGFIINNDSKISMMNTDCTESFREVREVASGR